MSEPASWEQRLRTPQLMLWSLLGPAATWPAERSGSGTVLATTSGRTEVYAFDATEVPARLTQLTDRPDGTQLGVVSADGESCFWFDDTAGDELGRWCRIAVTGGESVPLLRQLEPAYPGGLTPLRNGRVVLGRVLDAHPPENIGFELAVVDADGAGQVVYSCADAAELVDVSDAGDLALLMFAPDGDWLHQAVRVVRLSDGVVLAELVEPGRNLQPVAFRAADVHQVLVVHEHHDRTSPGLWTWTDGGQHVDDITTSLSGDVSASWYPGGDALLLTELVHGRHTLHRLDLGTHELTPVPTPRGTIGVSSARPDGSVHALVSSSTMPVVLVRSHDGVVTRLIELDGGPQPAGVAATDVFVDGPAGRVHALLSEPTTGSRPHPTVFLPHGGPTHQDFDLWNDRIATLVDCGYAVVRVNYRGSTGYGAAWRDALRGRLGFIELDDITAVRDHLEAAGVVDPERTSIAGGSWGGFLTLMALGLQPERWRSGAALVPLADQVTAYEESSSFMNTYSASLMGGTLEQLPELYRETSPITYVDAVTAPLLITAGDNDPRCPPGQIDSYVERLTARGHDVVYERVAAGHSLPDVEMKIVEWRKVIDFLARTLDPTPTRAREHPRT